MGFVPHDSGKTELSQTSRLRAWYDSPQYEALKALRDKAGKEIAGVLIDYDFTTNTYREAGLMF